MALQHLPLIYRFWAVNDVTFTSTLLLVKAALWVEQRTLHQERQALPVSRYRRSRQARTCPTCNGSMRVRCEQIALLSRASPAGSIVTNCQERSPASSWCVTQVPLYALAVSVLMLGVRVAASLSSPIRCALAQRVQKSTDEIHRMLEALQGGTQDVVRDMHGQRRADP